MWTVLSFLKFCFQGIIPTPHFIRQIEEILLSFRITNHVILHSEGPFSGRQRASKIVAGIMDIPYLEITNEESLSEQMKLVLRLEKPVLFVFRQKYLSKDRWKKVLNFAVTNDILSVLTQQEICEIIDPKDYHADKEKIRFTALEHIQQKWATGMKFLICPEVSETPKIPSSVGVTVPKWQLEDWSHFINFNLKNTNEDEKSDIVDVAAKIIFSLETPICPSLVKKCLSEYEKMHKEKSALVDENFVKMKKVCDSIDRAHQGYSKMIHDNNVTKKELELSIETLERLKSEAEICLEDYRVQFQATLETEKEFNKLQIFVDELRVQTDTNSQAQIKKSSKSGYAKTNEF